MCHSIKHLIVLVRKNNFMVIKCRVNVMYTDKEAIVATSDYSYT